jgi:hypothetical protein
MLQKATSMQVWLSTTYPRSKPPANTRGDPMVDGLFPERKKNEATKREVTATGMLAKADRRPEVTPT